MAAETSSVKTAKGGSFLLEETLPEQVFTPEDLSEEHRHIIRTVTDFSNNEVLPAVAEIEAKNFDVIKGLLRKAGELGLSAVDIPEAYGGLEMDKITSLLIAESLNRSASFSVAFGAHSGIGTLPLVWYGTEEQKKRYLPKLASGEWVAAYALSEASSGSDAMNIRAHAKLSSDGKGYLLNGEKMWISNCGFADLYTVFAKIDGERFSAFLVERNSPGLSIGSEEHKLGIRGSSTCPLILNDCRVPAGNLLGEAGKGHQIAFNILNIGRLKLGAGCVGAARAALQHTTQYAKDRKAFGKSIAQFGLIQEKIAECATGIFVGESLVYRTIGMIDAALANVDHNGAGASREVQKRIEEYAVECSILKIWGSEMLDMVVDHMVQVYAGYGYVEEYPAAAAYRDARINRIFEGTNEVNRLIVTGWLMKRAMAGQLPLLLGIKRIMDELMEPQIGSNDFDGPLAAERHLLANAKKITLFAAGAASQKHIQDLQDQQEIMGALADCIIEVYALESCLLRAVKLGSSAKNATAMTKLYATSAIQVVERCAKKVMAAVAEGDILRTQMTILRRFSKYEPSNTIELARQVARHALGF